MRGDPVQWLCGMSGLNNERVPVLHSHALGLHINAHCYTHTFLDRDPGGVQRAPAVKAAR